MKQKFLVILYELRRRYSLPFNWMFKNRLKINFGLCDCVSHIQHETRYWLSSDEKRVFWAIIREEGIKFGASNPQNLRVHPAINYYWWPEGKLKPRLKTIKAAIKRIESSNI